jgi:hypothetical protein
MRSDEVRVEMAGERESKEGVEGAFIPPSPII